jgi:TusA-related sulfurtransferase
MSTVPSDQTVSDPPAADGAETPGAIALRLDTRGLACPMPIVKTTQAIATLASGQLIEVLAYHAKSLTDFPAWSRTTGHAIVESSVDGDAYRFVFRRK